MRPLPPPRPRRVPGPAAALVGLVSVGAALGVGHLVAALVAPTASPLLAVGNSAIDVTPAWLKTFAINAFGVYDKLVLLAGMAVIIGLFGVLVGVLSRRSALPGLVLLLVLGAVAVLAVLARPTTSAWDVFIPLVALLTAGAVFVALRCLTPAPGTAATPGTPVPADPGPAGPDQGQVSRRRLFTGSAAVAVGAGLAGATGQWLIARGGVAESRRALGRIVPDVPAPPIPPGADFAAAGSPTFITPNPEFYRVDVNLTLPQLRAEDWRLRIHGMVDRELTLDWAALTSRRLVERTLTMTCVSNEVGGPYVSTANFTGVLLADLLAEAGVAPGADQVFTTSVDGWTCGTPTEDVLDSAKHAMLAIAMNGEPLPVEHGFPVRMVMSGLYGFVSATKWIVDLELTTFTAKRAYWAQRSWAERAPIKTMARIDSPGAFQRVPAGTPLTGVAWAQSRGIERVEVRIDRGEWQQAELSTEVNVDSWRMWRLNPEALAPGLHTAQVRATDRTGVTQPEERVPTIPDGATGWHSLQFTVQ